MNDIKKYIAHVTYFSEESTDCILHARNEDDAKEIARIVFEEKHTRKCKFQSVQVREL